MYNESVTNKLKAYFIKKLDLKPSNKKWYSGKCPQCFKKNKFGINFNQNRCNCFVCGGFPSPMRLLMQLEGFETLAEGQKFIRAFSDSDYLSSISREVRIKLESGKELEQKRVGLPEGYTLISFGDDLVAQCARSMMKRRGFNIMNLALKGIGFVNKVGSPYYGYLIIPYYAKGKLIYFTARKIFSLGPKFKNPNLEDFDIGKSTLVYNMDALAIYSNVEIVESATNSLTLGSKALAFGGKKLSNSQISAILRSPIKKVTIILDPDALKEAYELALKLYPHKRVKVLELPAEKDVNDIGKKATLEIKKTTPYGDYNFFIKRLNEIREQ